MFNSLFKPDIGKLKREKNVIGLISALDYKKDRDVRITAAKALGEIRDIQSFESLINSLNNDNDPDFYQAVINSIVSFGHQAVDPLIKSLDEGGLIIPPVAANILGILGDKKAINPLIKVLNYSRKELVATAINSLSAFSDPCIINPLIAILKGNKEKDLFCQKLATDAIIKMGGVAVEPIIEYLNDYTAANRELAASILGHLNDARAISPLVSVLAENNSKVSQASAIALDALSWKPDSDKDRVAYWFAKDQYDRCVEIGEKAIETLVYFLKKGIKNLHVVNTLVKIGNPSVDSLIACMNDLKLDDNIRVVAAISLGRINEERAIEPILFASDYIFGRDNRDKFIRAVVLFGSKAVDICIDNLDNKNRKICIAAAIALGELGDTKAIEPLQNLIKRNKDYDIDICHATFDSIQQLSGKMSKSIRF